MRDALDTWGRLDAVVNNAAAGSGTVPDEDMVRLTLGVHFVGTVNLVRSALPVFREQRYGRIVNTGSGSVLGIPHTGIYAAGKGAVMAFTKVLANELRQEREQQPDLDITVNVIMPVAQTPIMPRVPDEEFQALLDTAFAPERTSPLVAVFAHESCPVSGELVQTGGGRVARFVLATTEGWQAPDDMPTPGGDPRALGRGDGQPGPAGAGRQHDGPLRSPRHAPVRRGRHRAVGPHRTGPRGRPGPPKGLDRLGRLRDVIASVYRDDPRLAPLIGPGGPFEVEEVVLDGVPLRVFVRAPRTILDTFDMGIAHADLVHLVHDDERITFADVRAPRSPSPSSCARPSGCNAATGSPSPCATSPSS